MLSVYLFLWLKQCLRLLFLVKDIVHTQYLEISFLFSLYKKQFQEESAILGDGYGVVLNNRLYYISFPDLDGALLSGPDCDRNVNANLLAEAGSSQDGGDAGRYHRMLARVHLRGFEDCEVFVYVY